MLLRRKETTIADWTRVATCVALAVTVTTQAKADQSSFIPIHPQSNLAIPFVPYHEPVTNLDFDYPKEWHVGNADKDSVLKLTGTLGGKFAELSISEMATMHVASAAKDAIAPVLERTLPKCQPVSERKVRFGSRYQYSGEEVDLRFSQGETLLHNRLVFFATPDAEHVFCAAFLCQENDVHGLQPFFDKILSTFHQTQTSHIKPVSATSGARQPWKLTSYCDKFGRITLSYPEGWKFINNDPGKELDIKFEGASPAGMPGGLHLSNIDKPPNMSLEQFEEQVETTYLKTLPSYAKQAAHRTVFGISRVDGLENSTTFSMDGHSARQANVFFGDSKHYYFVSLITVGWPEPEARDLFQRVLSSVKLAE